MNLIILTIIYKLQIYTNSHMSSSKTILYILLIINIIIAYLHIGPQREYFVQLTVLGQYMLILNFILAILNHHSHKYSKYISRLHILTLSVQLVVIIGFWGLRIFFTQGIIREEQERNFYIEVLSIYMHGIGFLTLLYITFLGKVQLQFGFRKKVVLHMFWGIPYLVIQYLFFRLTGLYVYDFLKLFEFNVLAAFNFSLYIVSIIGDYFITFILEHLEYKRHRQIENMIKNN